MAGRPVRGRLSGRGQPRDNCGWCTAAVDHAHAQCRLLLLLLLTPSTHLHCCNHCLKRSRHIEQRSCARRANAGREAVQQHGQPALRRWCAAQLHPPGRRHTHTGWVGCAVWSAPHTQGGRCSMAGARARAWAAADGTQLSQGCVGAAGVRLHSREGAEPACLSHTCAGFRVRFFPYNPFNPSTHSTPNTPVQSACQPCHTFRHQEDVITYQSPEWYRIHSTIQFRQGIQHHRLQGAGGQGTM